ncbi:MAG: RhuM family protein [Methanosarcinaceae archaeon]
MKSDVSIAKNYLCEAHIKELNQIVSAYLDLMEKRAQRNILMKMQDWSQFTTCNPISPQLSVY